MICEAIRNAFDNMINQYCYKPMDMLTSLKLLASIGASALNLHIFVEDASKSYKTPNDFMEFSITSLICCTFWRFIPENWTPNSKMLIHNSNFFNIIFFKAKSKSYSSEVSIDVEAGIWCFIMNFSIQWDDVAS